MKEKNWFKEHEIRKRNIRVATVNAIWLHGDKSITPNKKKLITLASRIRSFIKGWVIPIEKIFAMARTIFYTKSCFPFDGFLALLEGERSSRQAKVFRVIKIRKRINYIYYKYLWKWRHVLNDDSWKHIISDTVYFI